MMRTLIATGVVLSATMAWAQSQNQQPAAGNQAPGAQAGQSAGGASDQALPSGFETQPVLKTGQTRDNDPIQFPDTENPEIVSVIGTIQPGGRTPLHQHPIPVFVYVLDGEIELQTEGGEPHPYKAGEAYIEALNRKHQVLNTSDQPAKILVVFMGEEGKPTTVTGN